MSTLANDARYEQLLTAASTLFGSKGYHSTTIDDIGSAMGLTGPALYRRVASKQMLLAELAKRGYGKVVESIQLLAGEDPIDPEAALRRTVSLYVRSALTDVSLASVMLREIRHLDGELAAEVDDVRRAYARCLRSALLQARPDLTTATAAPMLAAFNGLLSSSVLLKTQLSRVDLELLVVRAAMLGFGFRRLSSW